MVRRVLWRHRWLFVWVGVGGLLLQGIDLIFPYFTKLQLDQLTNKYTELFGLIASSPFRLFVGIVVAYAVMYLVSSILGYVLERLDNFLSFIVARDFIAEVMTYLKRFDASLLTGKRNQLIVSGLRDGNTMFFDLWSATTSIFRSLVQFAILLPLITHIDPTLFTVLVVVNSADLIWSLYDEKIRRQLDPIDDRIRNKLWATEDVLGNSNLHDLYLIGGEKTIIARHQRLQQLQYLHNRSAQIGSSRRSYVQTAITQSGYVLTAIIIAKSVFAGTMSIGTYTMVTLYTGQLSGALSSIFSTIRDSVSVRLRWRKFRYLYTLPTGYQDPIGKPRPLKSSNNITLALTGTSFRYPNMAKHERQYLKYLLKDTNVATKRLLIPDYLGDEMKRLITELTRRSKDNPLVLKSVEARFEPGKITAIVGENGAGKSTLIKLLLRAYDPTNGSVTINDEPYVNYRPAWLRQRIAYLSQEPFLIDGLSVHENLVLGCTKQPDPKQIAQVLKTLELDRTVNELPKKIHSLIGSDTDLSGGQRQLLAVARVILQDRPVLIMDEGSSQLDALRELALLKLIRSLATKKNKTVIIVTHRLTTARHADQIYVVHNGRLTESGQHAELIRQSTGFYGKLWRAQTED